tara:strand:+ start:1785 stop:2066 length:282 start_codon:yes stop_codon:yes gene_type:complete
MTRFLFFVLLMGCSVKSTPVKVGPGIPAHALVCPATEFSKYELACMEHINKLCPHGFVFVNAGGEVRNYQFIVSSNPQYVSCLPEGWEEEFQK